MDPMYNFTRGVQPVKKNSFAIHPVIMIIKFGNETKLLSLDEPDATFIRYAISQTLWKISHG